MSVYIYLQVCSPSPLRFHFFDSPSTYTFSDFLFLDSRSEGSLSLFIDVLLGHFRKLISELRTKEYHSYSWQSWYNRTGSGHLVRQACTAASILNELVFGLSDQAIATFGRMFQSNQIQNGNSVNLGYKDALQDLQNQKTHLSSGARSHLADLIGSILHEYLSPELWDLPLGFSSSLQQSEEDRNISLHSFTDNQMLHQVSVTLNCLTNILSILIQHLR